MRELFHVSYWLARTYGRRGRPEPGVSFRIELLPAPQNLAQIQAEELRRQAEQLLAERDTQLNSQRSPRCGGIRRSQSRSCRGRTTGTGRRSRW